MLIKLNFTEGQMVKAGDTLAQIDPRPYQAALDQVRGQLARDTATLANARVDLNRYQSLAAQNAISAQQLATQQANVGAQTGIVEADEMDFRRCLEIQRPYLGAVKGFYTDWTPLTDRPGLFPEDIDTSDPWQFRNVLVR